MQIEDAHGQQTVQVLFTQIGPVQYPKIGPCEFEMGPDKRLQYVFAGTFEHYGQFKQMMEQHSCYPAHEIPGETLNIGDAMGATVLVDEPVVVTDPDKSTADTLSETAEIINDGMTDAERAAHVAAQGGNADAVLSAALANGGQPPAGADRQTAGASGGDNNEHRSGSASDTGGGAGGTTAADNGGSAVRSEVKPDVAKKVEDDPFAGI